MKKLLTVMSALLLTSQLFAQMPTCTGGDPSCILCYGDFENFTSTASTMQGLSNGVYTGMPNGVNDLQQNASGNSTKYLSWASCPNGTINVNDILTFPLKSPITPCESGTFEMDYSGEPNTSGSSTTEQSKIRVYFFENNVPAVCANSELLTCGAAGNYDMIELTLSPAFVPNWQTLIASYQNSTPYTFNYIAVEYVALNNTIPTCLALKVDNFSFCTDPISESISLSSKHNTFCSAQDVVATKIVLAHDFCQLLPSSVNWTVVSGDFASITSVGSNFIWVTPSLTTTYQVTVTTPSGAVLTDQITIYVGATAGYIVPSTYNPPINTSFWLTLQAYNGTYVTWQKSTYQSGTWSVFTTFASGSLPATATVYESYTGIPTKYRAIVRCGGSQAVTTIIQIGKPKVPAPKQGEPVYRVQPNPTTDAFIIVNEGSAGNYALYDMSGKQLLTGTLDRQAQVDVSTLEAGVYLLTVTTEEGISSEKIIKE